MCVCGGGGGGGGGEGEGGEGEGGVFCNQDCEIAMKLLTPTTNTV